MSEALLPAPHPRRLEDAAMQLALAAEEVDRHIMDSGLAWRRQRLRDEILTVKAMVEEDRAARSQARNDAEAASTEGFQGDWGT